MRFVGFAPIRSAERSVMRRGPGEVAERFSPVTAFPKADAKEESDMANRDVPKSPNAETHGRRIEIKA